MKTPLAASVLVLASLFVFFSCSTVPETGRKQLLLVSANQEVQLGMTEFDKLKQSTPISRDPAINALAQRVGKRIAASVPLPNAQWEFVVFDDAKTANAFCLPGGKVGIYTGILPITQNEGGMATVMGHEIAHAVARHGAERLSQSLMVQLGGQALDTALKNNTETTRALASNAYGLGSTLGYALPHSRAQELEADRLGLIYMARAGFDPHEAIAFWKRFAAYSQEHGGGSKMEFLSTHPLDEKRIAQLESLLPQAMKEYRAAGGR